MRDVLSDIDRWLAEKEEVALATVIQTWGSSPRTAGSRMAITASGKICGSVSGGCVEGAVVETAIQVLKDRHGQLLHFGVADETAWEVGLACGGSIDVFVNPLDVAIYKEARTALLDGQLFSLLTIINGPDALMGRELMLRQDGQSVGTLGEAFDTAALDIAHAVQDSGRSGRVTFHSTPDVEIETYVDAFMPPPTLIIVGGAHISIALVTLARALGFRTVVIDPRKAFGTAERFGHADQLIQMWPDKALKQVGITRTTAVAVLTHDPKIDDPALISVLPSQAFYVGALGSANTQAKRRQRLLDAGISQANIDRLRGPIGLDISAKSPEEIALAIMAEIIAERNRGSKKTDQLVVEIAGN